MSNDPHTHSHCLPCTDKSSPTQGATLDQAFLDAACIDESASPKEEAIILVRVGDKLKKFCGTGFIKVENGIAYLTNQTGITLTDLWHDAGGAPMDFSYVPVVDECGNVHASKGLPGVNSVVIWDQALNKFRHVPTSELGKSQIGQIISSNALEMVGFAPILLGESLTNPRQMKKLCGYGLVFIQPHPTQPAPGDCPGETACVATVIPVPEEDDNYVLAFRPAPNGTGIPFWKTEASLEATGTQGDPGEPGTPGEKGTKGDPGQNGQTGPAGPTGATGAEGPVGPQGEPGEDGEDITGTLNLTKKDIIISNSIWASLAGGQSGNNVAPTALLFGDGSADLDGYGNSWNHTALAGATFQPTGPLPPKRVQIAFHILYPSVTPVANIAPKVMIYKNGSPVATFATGIQTGTGGHITSSVQGSWVDTNVSGSPAPIYELRDQASGAAGLIALPIASGFFFATAYYEKDVVVDAVLDTP